MGIVGLLIDPRAVKLGRSLRGSACVHVAMMYELSLGLCAIVWFAPSSTPAFSVHMLDEGLMQATYCSSTRHHACAPCSGSVAGLGVILQLPILQPA